MNGDSAQDQWYKWAVEQGFLRDTPTSRAAYNRGWELAGRRFGRPEPKEGPPKDVDPEFAWLYE